MSFPRYEKYKDSGVAWLGEVPAHWILLSLRHCLSEIFNGLTSTQVVETDKTVPVTRIETISTGIIDLERLGFIDANNARQDRKLLPGDILFSNINSLNMIGNCAIYEGDKEIYAGMNLLVLRVSDSVKSKWLYWLIRSLIFRQVVESLAKPAINQASISQSSINSIAIAVPSNFEQQTIANFLDRETAKIDALVAEQQRLIELLKEKRQAVISHAVTKGLNPDAPMKDFGVEWLGELPEHWDISRLGYESWVRARLGWKGLKAEEYVDDGLIFLSTPNIKGLQIDFDNVNFISKFRYEESPEIKLNVGDVLLAKDGSTLGTVNVIRTLPRAATVNSSIAVITPNKTLMSVYLFYLFQSSFMENTIQRIKGGMGVPHLFQADINKFYIPLPTISEQQKIAVFLDQETAKIDELIAEAQRAIELLKERRTALISAAVTGKIDVRGLVADKRVV